MGSRGEDPIGDLVDELVEAEAAVLDILIAPSQVDSYFGNGCKTDILRRIVGRRTAVELNIRIGGW